MKNFQVTDKIKNQLAWKMRWTWNTEKLNESGTLKRKMVKTNSSNLN